MATLKEEALAYQPQKTMNIADLDKVPVNIELHDGSGMGQDGTEFKYKYIKVNEQDYRIAGSAIGQLKEILKSMPTLEYFKVNKSGQGMNTTYTVIPLVGVTPQVTEGKVE